jgi:hypothetical protein
MVDKMKTDKLEEMESKRRKNDFIKAAIEKRITRSLPH